MNKICVHGVFVEVFGLGVLITGKSGIGKSELALGLIHRGHKLIADDTTELYKATDNQVYGQCPNLLQDFIEVRGLGIINIRAMFGDNAIKMQMPVELIIHLHEISKQEQIELDRFASTNKAQNLLDTNIPIATLPVAPGRNLSILTETAVRNQQLKMDGIDGSLQFKQRQRAITCIKRTEIDVMHYSLSGEISDVS